MGMEVHKGATHDGTKVEPSPLPVSLSGQLGALLGVLVVRDVVDDEAAFLTDSVNVEGTAPVALNAKRGEYTGSCRWVKTRTLVMEREARIGEVLLGSASASASSASAPSSS